MNTLQKQKLLEDKEKRLAKVNETIENIEQKIVDIKKQFEEMQKADKLEDMKAQKLESPEDFFNKLEKNSTDSKTFENGIDEKAEKIKGEGDGENKGEGEEGNEAGEEQLEKEGEE